MLLLDLLRSARLVEVSAEGWLRYQRTSKLYGKAFGFFHSVSARALLFAMYLRDEKQTWIPRLVYVWRAL